MVQCSHKAEADSIPEDIDESWQSKSSTIEPTPQVMDVRGERRKEDKSGPEEDRDTMFTGLVFSNAGRDILSFGRVSI